MKRHLITIVSMLLALIVLACTSCIAGLEPVMSMARTGAQFVSVADPVLRDVYEAQQRACLARTEPERDPCIAQVRKDWAPVRKGLGDLRAAWCEFEPDKCQAQDAAHKAER